MALVLGVHLDVKLGMCLSKREVALSQATSVA